MYSIRNLDESNWIRLEFWLESNWKNDIEYSNRIDKTESRIDQTISLFQCFFVNENVDFVMKTSRFIHKTFWFKKIITIFVIAFATIIVVVSIFSSISSIAIVSSIFIFVIVFAIFYVDTSQIVNVKKNFRFHNHDFVVDVCYEEIFRFYDHDFVVDVRYEKVFRFYDYDFVVDV